MLPAKEAPPSSASDSAPSPPQRSIKGGAAGWTNFTFTQQVNAGGIVPAWLMNTLVAQDAVVFVKRIGGAAKKQSRKKRR